MFAVFESGGKQHRVAAGAVVRLEKLEAEVGGTVEFDRVMMVSGDAGVTVGKPYLTTAKVVGEVVKHGRGDKVRIVKFRRRKNRIKWQGHRQDFTEVRVTGISA